MLWYFAYGSNLLIEQMIARTGESCHGGHRPRFARLADHRLVFQRLTPAGTAFANIVSPGDGVLGVVYSCSPAALDRLDDYERGYTRQLIRVTDHRGEVLEALAYVMTATMAASLGRPSDDYLKKIVDGARQHGLPEQYIGNVVATASVGFSPEGRSE